MDAFSIRKCLKSSLLGLVFGGGNDLLRIFSGFGSEHVFHDKFSSHCEALKLDVQKVEGLPGRAILAAGLAATGATVAIRGSNLNKLNLAVDNDDALAAVAQNELDKPQWQPEAWPGTESEASGGGLVLPAPVTMAALILVFLFFGGHDVIV